MLQAQAKILAEVLRQLLPKQPTTPIGPKPICVKVLPTDIGRTSVVMVHDPAKDGLTFLTGHQESTDPTTAHTAARLLQEQLGMCYGPDAVEHIVTSPVDQAGVVTQIFVLSLPLNILRQQYRTGPDAQRAIDATVATRDLSANPRVIVQVMPVPREVTAVAIPGTMPIRYRIPYGVLVPWEPLTFKMSFRDAVPIVVHEGTFMIEERKTGTLSRLMSRVLIKSGGLTRFMPAVPVSLPDSFQRALPKFENQDASDSDDLRQWLQQLPTRLQLHGVLADSEQGVAAAATLFTGNLLAWWQEKVARAAPDKKETAGYDGLSNLAADILGAFVTTDRLGDAFNAMNNLYQGRQSLSTYHLF